MNTKTHILGYPRIGGNRELKKIVEKHWANKVALDELKATAKELRRSNWLKQKQVGLDYITVNDFSYYDHLLDLSCLVGNIPSRFDWDGGMVSTELMFQLARGVQSEDTSKRIFACEMKKWFDTNYHYLVPELTSKTEFKLSSEKIFNEVLEAQEVLGADFKSKVKPVLVGPLTYLGIGKLVHKEDANFDVYALLDKLVAVYEEILKKLDNMGCEWIQIDEPILSLDLEDKVKEKFASVYKRLADSCSNSKLMIANYFGDLRDNLDTFLSLPVDGLHVDLVRGAEDTKALIAKASSNKVLSLGVVNGRNIWKNNIKESVSIVKKFSEKLGVEKLWISSSCSLLHSPISLKSEVKLDAEIKDWLAFAEEKLEEIIVIKGVVADESSTKAKLKENQASIDKRNSSKKIHNDDVKKRYDSIKNISIKRGASFAERQKKQKEALGLPNYPITTIGSFPQTKEVRSARARFKKGELSASAYKQFLQEQTKQAIEYQEEMGVDVLVHGEFERNDMVEYFGEQLSGYAFTQNGWVQSYGSRCVKPPILYGDVYRPKAMTVEWSTWAQSQTKSIMKGMLTGPITMLQWSFVRDDQPRKVTAKQIALAIQDEVLDLEQANIKCIQIDEAALREGLPLRQADWQHYLKWAVEAFCLSYQGVQNTTQIHTHMCYSEFNDIIESIAALDADVISIETSKSKMQLLDAFSNFKYPNEIGPGVYDIHSPRIPTVEEMVELLKKASLTIPKENLWVNPDCGLKTRNWEEVLPSLKNLVAAAKQMRK